MNEFLFAIVAIIIVMIIFAPEIILMCIVGVGAGLLMAFTIICQSIRSIGKKWPFKSLKRSN